MPTALRVIDLLIKPEVSGIPEIEAAPIMQHIAVNGMVL